MYYMNYLLNVLSIETISLNIKKTFSSKHKHDYSLIGSMF